jgi:hypothetical protein
MFPGILMAALLLPQASGPTVSPTEHKDLDSHIAAKVESWLPGGEHQDIPWKVRVQKPVLTFQQRNVVKVTADIDARKLQEQSVRRNLTFVIKVADEHGTWFSEENYVTEDIQRSLGDSTEVEMESEVILRPGKYTIAAIVYDSVLDQHDVSLSSIVVPDLKNDPLPQMLKNSASAEFVRGQVYGDEVFSPLHPDLPIENKRPVQIDLIVDFSSREQRPPTALPPALMPRSQMPRPRRFKLNDTVASTHLLQTASVLGALHPRSGCVRVSSFDLLKKQVFAPTLADQLDWHEVYEKQVVATKNTISVNALEDRKALPRYFVSLFHRFIGDKGCSTQDGVHIVIVLTHGLTLSEGEKVKVEDCGCIVFYLRQSEIATGSDDLKGMLSPLNPKVLDFHDAEKFRHKLAELIKEIEARSQ